MLAEDQSRMLTMARRIQPRHALPGIQEPLGGGNPKRYLEQTLGGIFWVFPPDWAQLGDEKVARVARTKVLGKVQR